MVQQTIRMKSSCFLFLIFALEVQGCWSLNSEGLALLKFRDNVEVDPFGALGNWNADDHEPCKWHGVYCEDDRVVMVNLKGYDLEGILAPELGNLSYLRYLDLSKNHISSLIPPELGKLTALEVLDLRENNLSGNVPSELGELHSLKHLLLCNNRLEGSVPVEIGKLCLQSDLRYDIGTITSAVAEIGCVNRKFGHCVFHSAKRWKTEYSIPTKWNIDRYLELLLQFKNGITLPDNQADNCCINLSDEGHDSLQVDDMDKQVRTLRRILIAEQTRNLIALPPSTKAPSPSEDAFLLRKSSGSFAAVPNSNNESPNFSPTTTSSSEATVPHGGSHGVANNESRDSEISSSSLNLMVGLSLVILSLSVIAVSFLIIRSRATRTLAPWNTGLSGQLRKAFVTGVPKLNRGELETACEDFSNIVYSHAGIATLYKGTLSSGVEIAVVSTAIKSLKEWSNRAEIAFRKKIDALSRVNHKNFVNLIGYCVENEPFTRMLVFEYAPNGTLFEHIHIKELEHLGWEARMRIIMGTADCLRHMHQLNPPVVHANLTSSDIFLTDDYAAKIADVALWADLIAKSKNKAELQSEHSELPPIADADVNTYSFGIMVLEVISGRLPDSEGQGSLLNWACEYLNDRTRVKELIDPSLKSFKEEELSGLCEVIQSCTEEDTRKRCTIQEACDKLRLILNISPEAAMPRSSPLWWAELEILSSEAA